MEKKKWEISRAFLGILALLCMIVLSAVLFECLLNYKTGVDYRDPDVSSMINSSWKVEEENLLATFPTRFEVSSDEVTFTKEIEVKKDQVIAIPLQNQYVSVWFNDILVYEEKEISSGEKSSLSLYTAFRVPEQFDGTVNAKIRFSSLRNHFFEMNDPILIGDDSNVMMYLLKMDLFPIALLAMLALLAVGLLAFGFVSYRMKIHDKRIISLVGLMAVVAVWVFVNLNALCMISLDLKWRTVISFMTLLMIPIPICTYAYYSFEDKYRTILNYCSVGLLLNLFFQFLIHYVFGTALADMLTITYALFVISFLSCLFVSYRDYMNRRDSSAWLLLAAFLTPVTIGLVSVILCIISRVSNPSHIVELGVSVFVILLTLDIIYSGATVYLAKRKLETEVSRYRKLSTRDALTGLDNRRGFDEYLEEIMEEIHFKDALLIYMDLNELKHANDVYGHDAGDDLIKRAAGAINEAYGLYGRTFRMGGDEFAAIILNPESSDARYMELLEKAQDGRNTNKNVPLTIAKGYSHLLTETGEFKEVSLWKSEADNNMYVDKIRSKIKHEEDEIDELSPEDLDQLTGLLNFTSFKRLAISLLVRNPEQKYALCFYNIKNFKYLNDIYGYEKGDDLLKFWANIIRTSLVKGEIASRQNADACVSLLKYEEVEDLVSHFNYVSGMIGKYEDTESFHAAIDAGFYLFRDQDRANPDINRLIDYANVARTRIEKESRSGYCFFSDDMYQKEKRKVRINQTLESAIAHDDIEIRVQPQVNYITGRVENGEILARWNHRELGLIFPGEFIPSLEKSGKIATLDTHIWEEACKILSAWSKDERYATASLSVNMSRHDMQEVDVIQVLDGLINKYQIDPKRLRIEINETDYGGSVDILADVIKQLHAHGFIVELDDFGSGHLSFQLLEEIDIDILKIDLKYLGKITSSAKGIAIIRYIRQLADLLEVGLVANSVETKKQAEFLIRNGVSTLQGYYFCKPMSIREFEEFYVRTGTADALRK